MEDRRTVGAGEANETREVLSDLSMGTRYGEWVMRRNWPGASRMRVASRRCQPA